MPCNLQAVESHIDLAQAELPCYPTDSDGRVKVLVVDTVMVYYNTAAIRYRVLKVSGRTAVIPVTRLLPVHVYTRVLVICTLAYNIPLATAGASSRR